MESKEILKQFIQQYDGLFGKFSEDDGVAVSPDGENESTVSFEVCDDIGKAYAEKVDFIESKRRKLAPMGKLTDFEIPYGFDRCLGCILNYDLMGKKGGFIYFVGCKENVLAFARAYHTSARETIPDDARDELVKTIYECVS